MLFGSGFVMFMLMGLVIVIAKAANGEKDKGCLAVIIVVGIIAACFTWFISLISML